MKSFLVSAIATCLLFACSDKQNKPVSDIQKSLAVNENPIISIEPSENVNLEDYWEEASAIQNEAEQIMNEAKKSNCEEAGLFAETAINLSRKTIGSNNFSEAEHLTGEAGEMVQNAENALVQCQEKTEQTVY